MSRLSEEEIREVKDVLSLFDDRGDGKITKGQVGNGLRALGLNPSEEEVKKVGGSNSTKDEDDRITPEDFLPMYEELKNSIVDGVKADFMEGFKVFDKEGNGLINTAEFRHVLCTVAEKLDEETIDIVLKGKEDANGNVKYETIVDWVIDGIEKD